MSDDALRALAEAAGIAVRWQDVFGKGHEVAPPTLRAVLEALGLPAGSDAQVGESRASLGAGTGLLPLVTAEAGQFVTLPVPPARWRLAMESGAATDGAAEDDGGRARITAPDQPGYHRLFIGGAETVLAVAPARCWGVADAAPGRRPWGLAVQLYALRRQGDGGIGDFAALRDFVGAAARRGASAVAISPAHAQFSADPNRFSPYAPSSRVLLNVLHASADLPHDEEAAALEAAEFVDWPAATRLRLRRMRGAFEAARNDPRAWEAFERFRAESGDPLESHARFEALHAHHYGRDPGLWQWRHWPDEHRDPRGPGVAAFAREHGNEVAFHAFLQYLADSGLRDAQAAARGAGMPIGLVADLAVGTDSGGSHTWSRPTETLPGLSIGAPPDLLSRDGQDWGLAAFSPRGLALNGFGAFVEMLRAAMRHAGGVRIDHAMGLARLWVLPQGAPATEGAYLHFPVDDMLRLVALESHRHRAIVLGEDLGTLPEGFQERIDRAGVMGMRVLWFERDGEARFKPPSSWTPGASAMTSTHDLATVAGWWKGRDLDWRERLGLLGDADAVARQRAERARDRGLLWDAMRNSGATGRDRPEDWDGMAAADAAAAHVGRAACQLVMLPVEDALALEEQPNLPGTTDTHPNWRRRLPGDAAAVLDPPHVVARLDALDRGRNAR